MRRAWTAMMVGAASFALAALAVGVFCVLEHRWLLVACNTVSFAVLVGLVLHAHQERKMYR